MTTDPNPTRRARPDYIPGVYNYCDGWCARCRFQQRCRIFRDGQRMEAALEGGRDPADIEDDDDDEFEAPGPQSAEVLALIEAANRQPTRAELAETRRIMACERQRREVHPLSIASREYADVCRSLVPALHQMVPCSDPVAGTALETIEHFSFLIAVKTRRAVGGLVNDDVEDDDDDVDDDVDRVQTDGNGCAKLVRSIVAESRDAWEVLMHLGSAATDDVPVQMIQQLEALDRAIAAAFPRAMEFVRPGFDDAT